MRTIRRNTIMYGVIGFIGVAAFFLLMKLLHLQNVTELRALNIVILAVTLNYLAKQNVHTISDFNYIKGLTSMLGATVITAALSTIGFLFCIEVFHWNLLDTFKNRYIQNGTFNAEIAGAILFFEAIASGLAISFISMQYWKRYESQMD